jgi:hypothetical protein
LLHCELYIVFAHGEVHGADVILACDHQIQQRVQWFFVFISCDLRNGPALIAPKRRIKYGGDKNTLRAAGASPHVLQAATGPGKLLPNGSANLRVLEALDKGF